MKKRRENPPFLHFFAFIFLKAIDKLQLKLYNIITGKGKPSNEERRRQDRRKGGRAVSEEQIKKMLELFEMALRCENVDRITITIKPNQKPKQTK